MSLENPLREHPGSKPNSGYSDMTWRNPLVAKYMAKRRAGPPSRTWRAFLKNHMDRTAACDFFVVPTVTFRLLFRFVIL